MMTPLYIFIAVLIAIFLLARIIYAIFVYYVPFSEGHCPGTLIKFGRRGFFVRTWEGKIQQGNAKESIFPFSVEDEQKEVIEKLKEYQGKYIKITFKERYNVVWFFGNTKYFVTYVEPDKLPYYLED